MEKPKIDIWGVLLLITFFTLLSYAGYVSFKSIKYDILTQLEKVPLVLPTPIIATPSAETIESATSNQTVPSTKSAEIK